MTLRHLPVWLAGSLIMAAAGCQATNHASHVPGVETVMVTYHVQPGREGDLQKVLQQAWTTCLQADLVETTPHLVVQDKDDTGGLCYVETFTWKKSPDHAPPAVRKIWDQEQGLCEPRGNHAGIEIKLVSLLTE